MKGGVEAKWVLEKSSGGENNILNVVSNSPRRSNYRWLFTVTESIL